jgi:hypothetical protein
VLMTSGAFQLLPLRAAGPSPSTRVVAAAWPMLVTATFVSSAYATVPSRKEGYSVAHQQLFWAMGFDLEMGRSIRGLCRPS